METEKSNAVTCQLMVIGAGMAGMAAALFAARRGISTVQAGFTGETLYASGLFDLYGVAHGSTRELIDDPWQGLKQLEQSYPEHPFCRVSAPQIRSAMDLLTDFLGDAGHPYAGYPNKNARLITPVGTIKRTYRVPETMWAGVQALEEKAPCLIVDIHGLRGFSAAQIVRTLKLSWPGLRAASIDLPWQTVPNWSDFAATISPTGRHIAYNGRDLNRVDAYIRSLDSLEARAVAPARDSTWFAFSPDGTWLAVLNGPSGGPRHRLVGLQQQHPSWEGS